MGCLQEWQKTPVYRWDFNSSLIFTSTTSQTLKEIFYVASPSTVLFIESDAVAQTSGIMLIQ